MPKVYDSNFQFDNELLRILLQHNGKARAIGRWDLVVAMFGADAVTDETRNDDNPYDRAMRKGIERMRYAGHHICNRGGGAGYYIAETREEYDEFKVYYLGPAYKKFPAVKAMDEKADSRWGKQPKPVNEGQMELLKM